MALVEHLEKLRHFYKVTNYRSINEAAKGTGLSQAGLSKSIASLELALDAPLFLRSRDGLVLTKEGESLLNATKKIIDEANQVETNIRSLSASEFPDKIRIGMYDSIAVYFFPDFASYIKIVYPKVEIELVVKGSESLSNLVETGEIDIAIGVNLDLKKSSKSEFFLLFDDHYSFYVSPKVESEQLRLPLIFYPGATGEKGSETPELLRKTLNRRVGHRVYNFETLKTLTSLGMGVGVLPSQVAKPLVQTSTLIAAKSFRIAQHFGRHSIGFLASAAFLVVHREFVQDIYRLGSRWAKT